MDNNLFTIEEVAKWAGLTRNAAYMHYRRGHLKPVNLQAHRLYFEKSEVDNFIANYKPIL